MTLRVSRIVFCLGALATVGCAGDGAPEADPSLQRTTAAEANATPVSKAGPAVKRAVSAEQFVARITRADAGAKPFSALEREYEGALTASITDGNLEQHLAAIDDGSLRLEARTVLLRSYIKAEAQLGLAGRREHLSSLQALLRSDSLPSTLKGVVLSKIGAHELFDERSVLEPYLHSGDSYLRAAAWRGLSSHVTTNRARHREHINRTILSELVADPGLVIDASVVRAVAPMGSEESRAFLIGATADDGELLATWLFHDPDLRSRRAVVAALRLMREPAHREQLAAALSVGLKQPGDMVTELLAGKREDAANGLELLRVFAELVPQHQAALLGLIHGADGPLRDAALALLPHFDDAAANIAKLKSELPDQQARTRFDQELTAAIARQS